MKEIGQERLRANVQWRVGVYGVTERASGVIEHLALIRVSKSRRVIVVKGKERFGLEKVPTFIWLDRVSPQDYIPEFENPENDIIDLYLDEYGNKVQAQ